MGESDYEPWIGVDLDGTLAEELPGAFDPEKIGEPRKSMLRLVRLWLRKGKKVKLFTARAAEPKHIPPIEVWLKKHDLDIEITNEKDPGCTQIWDNIAHEVDPAKPVDETLRRLLGD